MLKDYVLEGWSMCHQLVTFSNSATEQLYSLVLGKDGNVNHGPGGE